MKHFFKLVDKLVVGLLILIACFGAIGTIGYWIRYAVIGIFLAFVLGVAFMIGDTILKD